MNTTTAATPSRWARFKNSDIVYYFLKDKVAMFSFALFLTFVTASVLAPFIAPTDPYDLSLIDIMDSELPPSWMEEGDSRFFYWVPMIRAGIYSRPFFMARVCH